MTEGLPRPSRCEPMFWLNLLISAFLHLSVFPPPSYPLQWDTTPRTPTGHWPGDPKFINMGHFFPVCTVYLIHWWPQNLLLIETLRKKVHSEGIDSQKFYLTHKLVVSDRSLVFLQTAKVYWGQQKKYGVKMQPVVFQTSLHGSLEMLQGLHRGERKDKQAGFQGKTPALTRGVLFLWCVCWGFTQDFIWPKKEKKVFF